MSEKYGSIADKFRKQALDRAYLGGIKLGQVTNPQEPKAWRFSNDTFAKIGMLYQQLFEILRTATIESPTGMRFFGPQPVDQEFERFMRKTLDKRRASARAGGGSHGLR